LALEGASVQRLVFERLGKHCLGLLKLFIRQSRARDTNAGLGLEPPDFVNLPFGFRLGTGREVFPNTFSVSPTGNPKNDLPGGIREL
jgi:hypothetical protein